MRDFNYRKLKDVKWSSEIVNYIAQIRQLQGKQEQFLKQKPAELDKLVEIAKIQSTEASNAIEGISTTNTRLKQLVEQRTSPKNRDEEEIAGYRDVLIQSSPAQRVVLRFGGIMFRLCKMADTCTLTVFVLNVVTF